jgi:hypothetical protein
MQKKLLLKLEMMYVATWSKFTFCKMLKKPREEKVKNSNAAREFFFSFLIIYIIIQDK